MKIKILFITKKNVSFILSTKKIIINIIKKKKKIVSFKLFKK